MTPRATTSIGYASGSINGEAGADLIDGGDGNDQIDGSFGHDTLLRTTGDNQLTDSQDSNLLDGGEGNDRLIAKALTSRSFKANAAAAFTYNDPIAGSRTFLALNDATAGFSSRTDALIDVTGYSGTITSLAVF